MYLLGENVCGKGSIAISLPWGCIRTERARLVLAVEERQPGVHLDQDARQAPPQAGARLPFPPALFAMGGVQTPCWVGNRKWKYIPTERLVGFLSEEGKTAHIRRVLKPRSEIRFSKQAKSVKSTPPQAAAKSSSLPPPPSHGGSKLVGGGKRLEPHPIPT